MLKQLFKIFLGRFYFRSHLYTFDYHIRMNQMQLSFFRGQKIAISFGVILVYKLPANLCL